MEGGYGLHGDGSSWIMGDGVHGDGCRWVRVMGVQGTGHFLIGVQLSP
jgi:hypothetical protein